MSDVLGKLKKFFSIPGNVFKGLVDIFEGVVKEFTEAPQGVWYAALDTSVFIQYVWEFATTNGICAMKLMQNITSCIMYYFLDFLGQILYLPFRLAFFIVNLVVPGMGTQVEKLIWDNLEKIDRVTIETFGFHIIHFPKSVRDMCYNCRRLKPTVFVNKAVEIVEDLADPIIPLLIGGLQQMVGGLGRIMNAFDI
jgi:hypothetical protein